MATYATDETSAARAKPIELYKFVGTFQTYFYTSHNEDVVYDGDTYKAIPMRRSNIKRSVVQKQDTDLNIQVPATLDIIRHYALDIAPPDLDLTLYRYHEQTDVKVYWEGPVTNVRMAGVFGNIISPHIFNQSLAGEVPNVVYQSQCNHVLYDEMCGLDRASFDLTTTIVGWDNDTNEVTIASSGAFSSGQLNAGEIYTASERRTIISHTGTSLVISYPFRKYTYGMAVTVVRGCDHTNDGGCASFSNQDRFGGFKDIPTSNPFEDGIAQ